MVKGAREDFGVSFTESLISFISLLPLWPNHLSKVLLSNTITLVIRISTYELGEVGTNIKSVAPKVVYMGIIRKAHGSITIHWKNDKLSLDCVSMEYTWDYTKGVILRRRNTRLSRITIFIGKWLPGIRILISWLKPRGMSFNNLLKSNWTWTQWCPIVNELEMSASPWYTIEDGPERWECWKEYIM